MDWGLVYFIAGMIVGALLRLIIGIEKQHKAKGGSHD